MKLVEVIRTIATDPKVFDEMPWPSAGRSARCLSARPTAPASSSIACSCRICSTRCARSKRASASIEDIDNSMKLGCGYPMGPLTLLDFVGLDTTYYIANIMFDEFKEQRFAPPPLLKRMVLAGWNGRKAGRGFYDYSDPAKPQRRCSSLRREFERRSYPMPYENLLYEVRDQIAHITFNRPKVLNALNPPHDEEFGEIASVAHMTDASVRVLIITGAGEKSFIAGADINELAVAHSRRR